MSKSTRTAKTTSSTPRKNSKVAKKTTTKKTAKKATKKTTTKKATTKKTAADLTPTQLATLKALAGRKTPMTRKEIQAKVKATVTGYPTLIALKLASELVPEEGSREKRYTATAAGKKHAKSAK